MRARVVGNQAASYYPQSEYGGILDGQISGGLTSTEVEGAIDFSKFDSLRWGGLSNGKRNSPDAVWIILGTRHGYPAPRRSSQFGFHVDDLYPMARIDCRGTGV